MPIEQFRSVYPGWTPEDNAQRNASFQTSNPNVTVAPPTPATTMTEATPAQDTSNPANNGIVPDSGSFGYTDRQLGTTKAIWATGDELNTALKEQQLQTQPTPGNLASLYGIQQSGMTPEDTTKMPTGVYDANGNYLEKTVQPYYMTPETSKAYGDLQNDFSQIQVAGKQANSGKGIDPNFGVSLQQTWNVLQKIATSDAYKVKALAWERAALDAATQAFLNVNQQAASLPEDQKAALLQDAAAKLKMAMLPFAEKARAIEFGKYGSRTEMSDTMDTFMNGMKKFQEIYKSDEAQLKDFLGVATKSFAKAKVEYRQLKDLPSLKAKQELNSNPAYQTFLDTVVKNVPEVASKVETFRKANIITQDEKDFISKYFVGKYASQLFDARKAAIASLGPVEGSAMFKGLEDIIKIKDLPYQTREDDLLDTADFGQLDYSLNSGGGYTPYRTTSTWQSGWQSYNTRQASTRSVERTIW